MPWPASSPVPPRYVEETPAAAVLLLVDDRPAQPQLAGRRGDDEIAPVVEPHAVGALEAERDRARVGARSDDEVVLELAVAAIEDEADARIDLGVADAAERRDGANPLAPLAPQVMG